MWNPTLVCVTLLFLKLSTNSVFKQVDEDDQDTRDSSTMIGGVRAPLRLTFPAFSHFWNIFCLQFLLRSVSACRGLCWIHIFSKNHLVDYSNQMNTNCFIMFHLFKSKNPFLISTLIPRWKNMDAMPWLYHDHGEIWSWSCHEDDMVAMFSMIHAMVLVWLPRFSYMVFVWPSCSPCFFFQNLIYPN